MSLASHSSIPRVGIAVIISLLSLSPLSGESVARTWNEQNLAAIRTAFPDPPVHARNLFHLSVAMYDAWATYDETAVGYLYHQKIEVPSGLAREAVRREAISFAAYRVLTYRYVETPHPDTPAANSQAVADALDAELISQGYSPSQVGTTGDSPFAVGNRIAAAVLGYAASDRAREGTGYDDPTYSPVNDPLIVDQLSIQMDAPNRWQPLAFDSRVTQNGITAEAVQSFLGSHWGGVRPFSLRRADDSSLYLDPGAPPLFGSLGDAEFIANTLEVVRFSSWLDPLEGVVSDYSPATIGNNSLGSHDGSGHPVNPATNMPYPANILNRADFGRVAAEYWADGPDSETPPGHWNGIANETMEHPDFERRLGGIGPVLDTLEYEAKLYFALNGALHDAAIATWGCKREYDYVRPVSSIRYLASIDALPVDGVLVERITAENSASGEPLEPLAAFVGELAIRSWAGSPEATSSQPGGVDWVLARAWQPYQRTTFVTPSFAGYVSGHSAFSRAAAEVLTAATGSEFFPGGVASYTLPADGLLFEPGPQSPVTLQWATYYDASDQAGISRLYGGIHFPVDDGPGRVIGSRCGISAWQLARSYFDGSLAETPIEITISPDAGGILQVDWQQLRGQRYRVWRGDSLDDFELLRPAEQALEDQGLFRFSPAATGRPKQFYRIERVD